MKLEGVFKTLKEKLPEEVKIVVVRGNIAPEDEKPVFGTILYTYWDYQGHVIGLQTILTDTLLEGANQSSIKAIVKMIVHAKGKYVGEENFLSPIRMQYSGCKMIW